MNKSEEFYGVVPSGPDKGRVSNYELAREMAYETKPYAEARIEGGDIAVEELFFSFPGNDVLKSDAGYEIEEIPAKRVYDKFLKAKRGIARKAVEDNRSWTAVNKPSSAGLPTLGKR